jgi:type 1 fimbria pilin
MRYFSSLIFGAALLSGLASFDATAACSANMTSQSMERTTITQSGPADKPQGTYLTYNYSNSDYSVTNLATCTKSFKSTVIVNADIVPGITYNEQTVFDSGIPGVGFTLRLQTAFQTVNGGGGGGASPKINEKEVVIHEWESPNQFYTIQTVKVEIIRLEFVATTRLKPGSYTRPNSLLFTIRSTGSGISGNMDFSVYMGASATFTTRACTVKSGESLNVQLPAVAAPALKEVGAVSSQAASFSVGIACDPNVLVYATMTDVSDPTNVGDVLSLSDKSTASGIGLKLYRDGQSTALKFGPDSSAPKTTNQWYVGSSGTSGKSFTLPFVARYVKTAPNIGVGAVDARSTITFSYQ